MVHELRVAHVTAVLTIIIATVNKIRRKTYYGGWSKAAGRVCFMDLQIKHITTILTHRTNIKMINKYQNLSQTFSLTFLCCNANIDYMFSIYWLENVRT